MGVKTVVFVTRERPDGREGFWSAIKTASRQGARISLLVVERTHGGGEIDGLLRAAAFAEAGYYPRLRERLDRETGTLSEQAAELRAWFSREAAAAGVELVISNAPGGTVAAVESAMASTPDLCRVLFSPSIVRDASSQDIRNLASRLDHAVIAIADRAGAPR